MRKHLKTLVGQIVKSSQYGGGLTSNRPERVEDRQKDWENLEKICFL
jgi:hypothetical protein